MKCTECGTTDSVKWYNLKTNIRCSKCYMREYNASDKARQARKEYEKTDNGKEVRKKIDHKHYYSHQDKRLAKAAKQTAAGYHNERYKNNKAYYHEKSVRRTRQMDKASLGGLHRKETVDIYDKCPDGHEVDHIVPLKGYGVLEGKRQHTVSGLHVPWNLQHLPRSANRKKSNKLMLTKPPVELVEESK